MSAVLDKGEGVFRPYFEQKEFAIMKFKKSTMVWVFIWSLFMGVTAISIGFGALFPPLNYVAAPFVCPGGTMSEVQEVYHPSPGSTVTTVTWYCTTGATGEKNELSMWPMSVASGLIYGLLLFLVILLGMTLNAHRTSAKRVAEVPYEHFSTHPRIPKEELKELERLRNANVIGDTEFERRVTEIAARTSHKY